MNVIDLSALQEIAVDQVGSKARNLGGMLDSGYPVPPGFVVTAQAFRAFLQEQGYVSCEAMHCSEEQFIASPLSPSLTEDIRIHYNMLQHHGVYAVAVRSSSALEDLESASFAGQYETFLNIRSFEDMLIQLKRCWYSYFAPAVQHYADNQGISMEGCAMGVLIQGMVDAEVSGVIFSKNPVTHNNDEIVINASYGLGEAVVSGIVTPDCYYVSKSTGAVVKELGQKEVKVIPCEAGTETICTVSYEQDTYCLDDIMIRSLCELTERIEKQEEAPVDIEFSVKNGRIHLLQVRPITT